MDYLITGVEGFLGREISAQLRQQGLSVRGLVRQRSSRIPLPDGVERIIGDVLVPESLDAFFSGIDQNDTVLIHAAAVISVRKHNKHCEQVNILGTKNILNACKNYGVKRIIHIASVDALPISTDSDKISEPKQFSPNALSTSYGCSKAAAAQLILNASSQGMECTILLPSAIIGPGDYRKGAITNALEFYLLSCPRLSISGGYEFVDVRDVASATITASKMKGQGDCYILSNCYADVTKVLDTCAKTIGRKPILFTLPIQVLYPLIPLISLAFRIAGKESPLTMTSIRLMNNHPLYCHDKAVRELGFSPRPLEQSIKDNVDFIQKLKKDKVDDK